MTCFQPAPDYYVFVMHNLHFVSAPIYVITLTALFRETSKVFQTYKWFLIVHIFVNFLSEAYVTFLWLPLTHLPYDVYKTTGWLAQLGVSGVTQFMGLAQFIIFIGASILEMFYHRFKVVVIHHSGGFLQKLPAYGTYLYRILTVVHLLSITWITVDSQTLVYQQNKKDELFRRFPDIPLDLGCYTVFILAPEDPILVMNVAIWGVLALLGTIVIGSSVVFIMQFLKIARNLSKETKKLQRMLIFSLLAQATIHGVLIIFPVIMQIYQIVFSFYDNDFATLLLFFIAYHGFFSTCAMMVFTMQIRQKIGSFTRCCGRRGGPLINNQVGGNSTFMETTQN